MSRLQWSDVKCRTQKSSLFIIKLAISRVEDHETQRGVGLSAALLLMNSAGKSPCILRTFVVFVHFNSEYVMRTIPGIKTLPCPREFESVNQIFLSTRHHSTVYVLLHANWVTFACTSMSGILMILKYIIVYMKLGEGGWLSYNFSSFEIVKKIQYRRI